MNERILMSRHPGRFCAAQEAGEAGKLAPGADALRPGAFFGEPADAVILAGDSRQRAGVRP
jgi:hypothetical protein